MPLRLRTLLLVDILKCCVMPIKNLYDRFKALRANNIYELTHNGQVCRLEAVLNDRFDLTLRRIRIVDADVIQPLYIYKRSENKPLYIFKRVENHPIYMRKREELTMGGKFIVRIPASVVFDVNEMNALIKKYKQAGKAFTLKIV